MSRPGPASRRNTLRSSDQQRPNPTPSSSNASARRPNTRNAHNITASQASTPSSINPSVAEEGYREPGPTSSSGVGQAAEQGLAPFDLSTSFAFPTGGPLMWDWHSDMDFGDFTTLYEPQGELAAPEMQPQPPMLSDFSTPFRVTSDAVTSASLAATPASLAAAAATSVPALSLSSQQPDVDITTEPGSKRAASKRKEIESAPTTSTAPVSTSNANATSGPTPSAAKRARTTSSNTQPSSSRTAMTRSKASSHRAPPPPAPRISQSPSETDSPRAGPPQPPETSSTASPEFSMKKREQQVESTTVGQPRLIAGIPKFTAVLPAGKVFPIQIGSELFRLSGASISSDAPSYFSHYFSDQLIQTDGRGASSLKTLYIDRDPVTFRDIALHLQGYYVKPRDSAHFVKLFADAQFYSLPRLTQQLFKSEIYIRVGDRDFEIPRDMFSSPGDSPNYFSLGFAHFFSTPSEVFPGLDRHALLRPPSILPPAVPNRSGDVFADLLRLLQGYDVKIRDESHRAELLRDARYFHLRGIEQRLIPCATSHNLLRDRQEILLKLEDIRQSGVSFTPDPHSPGVFKDSTGTSKAATPLPQQEAAQNVPSGWISYQRPFVDETSCELVLELSSTEHMKVDIAAMRATFSGQTKARISSLFQVVANKLNLPATMPLGLMMMQSGGGMAAQPVSPANSGVSGEKVRVRIMRDAWVEVDGAVVEWGGDEDGMASPSFGTSFTVERGSDRYLPPIKRWKDGEELYANAAWVVRKSQWRLRVEASEDDSTRVEVVMCAARIMAYTEERFRNAERAFLT